MTWTRWLVGGAAAALAACLSVPAHALVTFESTVSDIECGVTSASGTVFGDCDTPSFDASLTAGQTAFLRATLVYHYTDDGLPLPRQAFVQGDKFGFNMIPVFHEVGALYVQRNDCARVTCPFPSYLEVQGTPFSPLLLGHNDVPDDLTGSLPMFVEMGFPQDLPGGWSGTLQVGAVLVPFSAPVPEPGTWALVAAGLLASVLRLRRQRGMA